MHQYSNKIALHDPFKYSEPNLVIGVSSDISLNALKLHSEALQLMHRIQKLTRNDELHTNAHNLQC